MQEVIFDMDTNKKQRKNVAIIILNYMNYMETDNCIECMLKQNYEACHIIVVDNGSTNGSFLYLWRKYRYNAKISVIKTGKNYGFAKGNNIGIHYAKKKIDIEYVLLLNSDVVIDDRDYLSKMVKSDVGYLGVIGSRILEKNNLEIPMLHRYVTFPSTLFFYLANVLECKGCLWYKFIWEKILNRYKGVYLFKGCVLLLTPAYLRHYDGLDPRTFLYCEEDLLYLRCKKAGLEEKVNKETYVYHKSRQSTKALYGNGRTDFLKYMLASYKFVLWESVKMLFYGGFSERIQFLYALNFFKDMISKRKKFIKGTE